MLVIELQQDAVQRNCSTWVQYAHVMQCVTNHLTELQSKGGQHLILLAAAQRMLHGIIVRPVIEIAPQHVVGGEADVDGRKVCRRDGVHGVTASDAGRMALPLVHENTQRICANNSIELSGHS